MDVRPPVSKRCPIHESVDEQVPSQQELRTRMFGGQPVSIASRFQVHQICGILSYRSARWHSRPDPKIAAAGRSP